MRIESKKVKLLKLEAEGFEPEILQGSNKVLNKIEYIGVDVVRREEKKMILQSSTQLIF